MYFRKISAIWLKTIYPLKTIYSNQPDWKKYRKTGCIATVFYLLTNTAILFTLRKGL